MGTRLLQDDDSDRKKLSNDDLGFYAYNTYRVLRNGTAYDGTRIPEWGELNPEIRQAWTVSALVVAQKTVEALIISAKEEKDRIDSHLRRSFPGLVSLMNIE